LADDVRAPRYVETVPRRGYRFIASVESLGRPGPDAQPWTPPAAPTPASPNGAVLGNLPPLQPGLVGREAELAVLSLALKARRLVTLTGFSGVGKTRLALALSAQSALRDGAWLVRLEDLHDAPLLVPTLAQTLRLGPNASVDAAALGRALRPLQMLLVLDNAEHLVEAVAGLAAALLSAAPDLHLLVTSHLPLHLADEQVVPLAPLGLPADGADLAPQPDAYAAARLLCERVSQRLPGWTPRVEDHAHLAAICRQLDGVPLALELASARVPLLGLVGVRSRLEQRFALLTRAPRDAAQRHRTLAAALDWTFGMLSGPEQRALLRLAVFVGSFTAEAAEAMLADRDPAPAETPLDLMESLRERSLLALGSGPGGPRLRLFDSVRRYALDLLVGSGDESDAHARHLAWMRRCFEAVEEAEFHAPLLQWLAAARDDIDSLRAALRHGLRDAALPAEREDALRLLAASAPFWYRSGNRLEGWRWLQAAQSMAAQEQTRVLLDHAVGVFLSVAQVASPALAVEALRRSRPVLSQQRDHRRCYMSLLCECSVGTRLAAGFDRGPLVAEMQQWIDPAWGAFERRHFEMVLANIERLRGNMHSYVEISARISKGCRSVGGLTESWASDNAQGQGLTVLGRLDDACALLGCTLAEVRAAGLEREHVSLLAITASVHLRRDGSEAACALGREALRLLHADGMVWWMADALPWAAWHDGRAEDAARLQAWADGLVRTRGDARGPFFGALRDDMLKALATHAQATGRQGLLEAATEMTPEAAIDLALGAHAFAAAVH
jgi:predicted ATPase